MECNKDEAIRAKEIAEKKMSNNDFEGARKIALKAQNLSPELDNISQLLSICDVHCSAQTRILGSEKDWYGILQVQRLADQITIKKQYRRLALILHPDKNRFPGAEAAFKLICEANAVLSDTVKKTLYDNKVHVSIRCATVNPSPRPNQNGQFNKQQGFKNNIPNGFNQQQASGSNPSVRLDVFWTCCPYCSIKYQYHRQFVNRSLRCPTCLKPYMAYEIGSRGDPMGPKCGQPGAHVKPESSQPAASQQKLVPNPGNFKMGAQYFKGGAEGISRKTAGPKPGIQTGSGSEGIRANEYKPSSKANGTRNDNTNPMNEGGKSNGVSMKKESGNPKNKSKKRGRKQVVESSDSFDCSSDSDMKDVTTNEAFVDRETDMKSEANRAARRSVWRKHNVTYNESDIDDLVNSFKTSNAGKDGEEDKKDSLDGEFLKNGNQKSFTFDANVPKPVKTVDLPEEILQKKDAKFDYIGTSRGDTGIKLGNGAEKVKIESECDIDSDDSDKCRFDCPDPEFNDFDKLRDASRFKVDQYWACYDPFDDMPRFYAKVKKVTASPFEVRITWLEAIPINQAFKNWVDEELPVGCGTFKIGGNDKIFEVATFSHEVQEVQKVTKGKKIMYFSITPRKGEIWALFKDWDMSWNSDKINQKEFKYEVVEVLSDFVEGAGIKVCYLDKVAGFVSLFQKMGQSVSDSFFVGPDKVYSFSHCVPSFKMTGSERAGVPVGSFELDPASLPLNPDYLHHPPKAKIESGNVSSGVFCSPAKSAKKMANSVTTDSKSNQKDFVDLDGSDEASKVRKSRRGVNIAKKNTKKSK